MARNFLFTIVVITLTLTAGCGGGGSSVNTVTGTLVDAFGALITHPGASISIQGTSTVTSPGPDGKFTLTSEKGPITVVGTFIIVAGGIKLKGSKTMTVVDGASNSLGNLVLSDSSMQSGWNSYRNRDFAKAESLFNDYLDAVRAGQADYGSTSAYVGLGWTHGRGMNDPNAGVADFGKAISGWSGNIDAQVGLAACELGRMTSTGTFRFNEAISAATLAIDPAGTYSSGPTHDDVAEVDVKAYKAFLNLLNGNTQTARFEALEIGDDVATGGNKASSGVLSIILEFTE